MKEWKNDVRMTTFLVQISSLQQLTREWHIATAMKIAMADSMELLFFDTFSHDSSDDLNLDLVQFPRPVYINEVRIIPLGARVQADFPGGVRLGATNPSQFRLEFFVNDLSKPGASTFEGLGSLEYKQNVDIQLSCSQKIPTDGLVLRGWYSTITVAVYGSITKLPKERTPPPPPPPPQTAQRSRPLVIEGRASSDRDSTHSHESSLALSSEWDRDIHSETEQPAAVRPITEPVIYAETQAPSIPEHIHYPERQTYQEITPYPEHQQYPEYNNFQDRNWQATAPSEVQSHNIASQHILLQNQSHLISNQVSLPQPQHNLPQHNRVPTHKIPPQHPGSHDSYGKQQDAFERQPYSRDHFEEKVGTQTSWDPKEREHDDRRDPRNQRDSRDRDFRDRERDYRERDRDRKDYRERDRDREYRDYPDRDRDRDRDRDIDSLWDKSRELRDNVERDREYREIPPVQDRHYREQSVERNEDYRERSAERDREYRERSVERDREYRERDRERGSIKDGRSREQDFCSRDSSRESQRSESKRPRTPPQSYSPKSRRPKTPPVPFDTEQHIHQSQVVQQDQPVSLTQPSSVPTSSAVIQHQIQQQPHQQPQQQPQGLQQPVQGLQQPLLQTPVLTLQLHQQPPPYKSRGPCSPPPPVKDEMEPGEVVEDRSDDFFEPLTPEQSPEPTLENLSDGEIHEGDQSEGYGDFVYEEILSEEEYMSDVEDRTIDMGDMDYDMGDDSWNFISSFNPYQCELTPLLYFTDPSLTLYEVEKKKMGCPPDENAMELAQKLMKTLEQFQDQEHFEKWVEVVETIQSLLVPGLAILMQSPEIREGIISTLLDWVNEGLDFSKALEQTQPVYKVRHLKAGIRLASALANCDEEIMNHLLSQNVQHKLLDLYEKDYMALSVKLLLLRALDVTTRTKEGLECFLCSDGSKVRELLKSFKKDKVFEADLNANDNKEEDISKSDDSEERKNKAEEETLELYSERSPYERLIFLLLTKQSTRAIVSITALLRKINIYEILQKFKSTVETITEKNDKWMTENLPSFENESFSKISNKYIDADCPGNTTDTDVDSMMIPCNSLNDADIETVMFCLLDIQKTIANAQQYITQPRRSLPVRAQFEILENPNNAYPGLYNMLRSGSFLECLFILLSCPATSSHTGIFDIIKDIFLQLIQTQHGLLFLLSQPEVMNGIIRLLTQPPDDMREENLEDNAGYQLGLQLTYHLQALQYVDAILELQNKENAKKEVDDPDVLSILQPLYTMIFVPIGRQAVVNILSLEYNLNSLIPFIALTGSDEYDLKLKKSASIGYAMELLLNVIRYSENIYLLRNFGEKLLNICSQESSLKLQEVASWLSVTKRIPNYSADAVSALCNIIKNCLEDVLSYPGELITAMRILKHLGVPHSIDMKSEEQQEELRYKYVIVQLFANEGLSFLITILQKICDAYQYPFQQNYAMIGPHWGMLLALVKPTVALVKSTLSYLIFCRNTDFKDLTSLTVLLRVYSLLHTLPNTSSWIPAAHQIQSDIIETLLAFTQPTLGIPDSEESLSKSLWTQMMGKIFSFVLTSSSTFFSGLMIISELLPLPLPMQTKEALNPEEITKIINNRKLWSAHLHSLSSNIREIIISLGGISFQPLQQLLRRVCIQIADLAASSALVVVRSVMDAVIESLDNEKANSEPTQEFTSTHTYRLLNMLAYLISHPCIKMAVIQLLRGNSKLDEKYTDLLIKLTSILSETSDKPVFLQIQECVVTIIQSLCDSEITLVSSSTSLSPLEQLANSLPPKDHMVTICNSLVEHIDNINCSYTTILPVLRTILMIIENDFGFYCIKTALDKTPNSFFNLLTKLSSTFTKDSSDCISTLNAVLEFFRSMLNTEDSSQLIPRTLILTAQELAQYINWKQTDDEYKHPLLELEKILADNSREDDNLELQLLDNVSSLIHLFSNSSPKAEREIPEPLLPLSEPLPAMFSARNTYIISDIDDDRLSPTYWLTQSTADESDQEAETVTCDLEAMADKYCPGLNMKLELGKENVTKDTAGLIKCKKKGQPSLGKRKYQPLINPGQKDRSGKKPFIAPMRGRGFSRGAVHPSRANDPFRSRPPNTSRPPSMHVDDFVAMEIFHPNSVPMGPTNKRPNKEPGRGRGRGGFESSRGFPNIRGRFINTQGSYGNRREEKGRGIARGVSRGGTTMWNNRSGQQSSKNVPKSSPNTQRGFTRGGVEIRSTPNNTRSQETYGGRFARGGGRGGGNNATHWSSSRVKDREARFSGSGGSGRGRREVGRHVRALTR